MFWSLLDSFNKKIILKAVVIDDEGKDNLKTNLPLKNNLSEQIFK
jgi:hypothetical protein